MPITAQQIHEAIGAYLSRYPADTPHLATLTAMLDEAGGSITSRTQLPGHVTTSAILLRPDERVLFIEHRALRKWLFPGGHVEPTDTTLLSAALRELHEETGITDVESADEIPLHIDTHPIPPNPGKHEPGHHHFDFRFLFRTTVHAVTIQEAELSSHAWRYPAAAAPAPVAGRLRTLPRHA